MIVSELFGPTLQGEGPNAGRRAMFLRLGGCNLSCSWCDTAYTWDGSRFDLRAELSSVDTEVLTAQIVAARCDRLVITGGEPLLQEKHLLWLLDEIGFAVPHVEVETNGTLMPTPPFLEAVERLNVSPKLAHSGNDPARAINVPRLRDLERTGQATYKFVVSSPADLEEVDRLVAAARLSDVWLMPEGTTAAGITERLGWICDAALERGYSVSSRLHVLAWGDVRGR